jgi:hypothetical protein
MAVRPTPREPGEPRRTTADHDRPDRQEHDLGVPWEIELVEDRSAFPYTDADTRLLIAHAVDTLVVLRNPAGLSDAGTVVSVLVSLAGQADDRLHDAVADARGQGYTWEQIADRLATSVSTARRRYRAYSTWRKEGCPWPMTRPTTEN